MVKRNKSDSGSVGKGHRYGSIMLVGEHGRVIPFRRFKEIAIAVIALACLSLGALAVIGYLYAQQAGTIDSLRREVDGLRRQAAQLKDEKDVLHAKLVIYEMQKTPGAAASPQSKGSAQSPQKPATSVAPTPMSQGSQPPAAASAPPQPIAAATPTSTPIVKWVVELQRFAAEFDARRELIKFSVRVVNKTAGHAFSGRIVLVIKQAGAAPNSWVSLPSVPLVQGKPTGKNGQAFSVKNYRTMDFKLYKQGPPVVYDTATAFVFLSNGELVLSQEFNFEIEVQVPPTATPAPPTQAPPASTPTPEVAPFVPAATPSAPLVPESTGEAPGDSGGGGLSGTPGGTPTPAPTQVPPQGPASSAPSPPAIGPPSVPETRLETEPQR